jgi:hypothetical protein
MISAVDLLPGDCPVTRSARANINSMVSAKPMIVLLFRMTISLLPLLFAWCKPFRPFASAVGSMAFDEVTVID